MLKYVNDGHSKYSAAKKYNVKSTKTIRDWKKMEEEIMSVPKEKAKKIRRVVREREAYKHSELFEFLHDWYW